MMLVAVLSIQSILHSQDLAGKPSRQTAMDAFDRGEYLKALGEFEALMEVYSFPLYKYYSGVCLVSLKKGPERAIKYLKEAGEESTTTDIMPDDAWFYLGRAGQLAGRFHEAMESYWTFREKAGKKKAREMHIAEYIKECRELKGSLPADETAKIGIDEETSVENPAAREMEKKIPVRQEVPAEYDRILSDAMKYQVMADSLFAVASGYRKQLAVLPASQQKAAAERAAEAEALSRDYQGMADERFGQAGIHTVVDTLPGKEQENTPQEKGIVISLFRVESDPDVYSRQNIVIDPKTPAGLVYRIQIGVCSKPVDHSFFRGIIPVYGFSVPGTSSIRYFAGMFRRREDAEKSLNDMKQMGLRDAFLTAVLDDKPVSLERALLMEAEWSSISLQVPESLPSGGPAEPATLSFRVEVIRSAKPLDEGTVGLFRTMSGSRGFEIIQADDGSLAYLIGKFITFESASDYADLLQRNGYSEARVVAYAGSREIPLDTARKLFEK